MTRGDDSNQGIGSEMMAVIYMYSNEYVNVQWLGKEKMVQQVGGPFYRVIAH